MWAVLEWSIGQALWCQGWVYCGHHRMQRFCRLCGQGPESEECELFSCTCMQCMQCIILYTNCNLGNAPYIYTCTLVPCYISPSLQPSNGSLFVKQFQHPGWPDHRVPHQPSSLLKFIRTVRMEFEGTGAPIVVHCRWGRGVSLRAGIGDGR